MPIKLSKGQRAVYELCENSWCRVIAFPETGPSRVQPNYLEIQFGGELGKLPSLKNSKLQGKNFINPKVKQRLIAMDILFSRTCAKQRRPCMYYGKRALWCLVLLGKGNRADEDNAFAAVKDWLEPPTKTVGTRLRNRGWGIGISENDRYIRGMPLKSKDTGLELDYTRIIIRPFERMRESVIALCAETMMVDGSAIVQQPQLRLVG